MKKVQSALSKKQYTWLVTGCAGFIGSNLVEFLLCQNQKVVGLDNFSTGKRENLSDVERIAGSLWKNFSLLEGDICSRRACTQAVQGVDFVLHQAALGSVPKSIEDPLRWHEVNATGTLSMLLAARDADVKGFVYASSSSVYGDSDVLPKVESEIGEPLSPYAVSKLCNEKYAEVFARCYEMRCIGLRYFNVFGKRQDPEGAYAAVIPKWIRAMAKGEGTVINGDGKTSRDFCYIANVVQANILAALYQTDNPGHQVFNVGVGERTDLASLHAALSGAVQAMTGRAVAASETAPFRQGDVRHSLASIDAITKCLGYQATHTLQEGIKECLPWYLGAR